MPRKKVGRPRKVAKKVVKPKPKVSKKKLIELVKEKVRENERRELSVSEERDPVEVIDNWDYYEKEVRKGL